MELQLILSTKEKPKLMIFVESKTPLPVKNYSRMKPEFTKMSLLWDGD